jgi:hypothetical protein
MPYSAPSPRKRNFTHLAPSLESPNGRSTPGLEEREVQRRGCHLRRQNFASIRNMKLRGSPYQNVGLGVSSDR